MGETIPPASKSQLASDRDEDPHESVTIAPPAPKFDDMLRYATPVPALPNRSDQHFRAAVDAGARAGSSLSELSKIVSELSGGLSGAKVANDQLVNELSTLRAMLSSAKEQQLALKQRGTQLEQELLQTREELAQSQQELVSSLQQADRERQFLTDQHDDFLAALIEEHEQQLQELLDQGSDRETSRMGVDVSNLTQKLVHIESARVQAESELAKALEALSQTQIQRDEAQARADKRERERDELRAEASQLRARLGTHRTSSTAPPPPVSVRPPSFHPPPALRLDAAELDSTLHTRSSPRLPNVKPRLTPPPAELTRAVYSPRAAGLTPPPSALASSSKTAREFPHESTRPGVGGPKPTDPPPPRSAGSGANAVDFGPSPTGWTPVPPPPQATTAPPPRTISAASLPGNQPSIRPVLKPKLDPTTRPLTDYSLGGDGLPSEVLEGVRLSSKPPRK